MFAEVAKPVTLVLCILSLYAVFNAAFLAVSMDMHEKICESLIRLALAAVISLISGLIFRDATQEPYAGRARLTATLPVQMFCWVSGAMGVLFVVSWYLETYCVFYRDVRF
jgi:uncharacterized membrane protein YdcZ (DUF606 family)